jgi:hypothetical protein
MATTLRILGQPKGEADIGILDIGILFLGAVLFYAGHLRP